MIKSWKHKGLQEFFETGQKSGIKTDQVKRLQIVLQRLSAAVQPEDMNTPGMRFHKLTGNKEDFYSVSINGNWRIIFKFEEKDAYEVDYLDYH